MIEQPFADNQESSSQPDDEVGLYLKAIGKVPLLTAQQEVELRRTAVRSMPYSTAHMPPRSSAPAASPHPG